MVTPELETERLILRPLSSEDAVQIQHVFPRWEIVRYLVASVPWPYPDNAAQNYVDNWHWWQVKKAKDGSGHYDENRTRTS